MRRRLDAWYLARALRVFERRGWEDAPGYPPTVGITMAHLGYRAQALRCGHVRIVAPVKRAAR